MILRQDIPQSTTDKNMNRITTLLTSKTVWGAVAAIGGYFFQQTSQGIPITGWTILQGLGALISVVGARDAITKATPDATTPTK